MKGNRDSCRQRGKCSLRSLCGEGSGSTNGTRRNGQGAVVFAPAQLGVGIRLCASHGRRIGILVGCGIQVGDWRAFALIRSGGNGSGFSCPARAKIFSVFDLSSFRRPRQGSPMSHIGHVEFSFSRCVPNGIQLIAEWIGNLSNSHSPVVEQDQILPTFLLLRHPHSTANPLAHLYILIAIITIRRYHPAKIITMSTRK